MNKILLVVNVVVVLILGFVVFKKIMASDPKPLLSEGSKCSYELKDFKFHYEKEPNNPRVLMLGNSLIERGNWNNILHRNDVINRGIEGDLIACICKRMNYLNSSPAQICFIEAGIEDIKYISIDTVLTYYKKLVQLCQEQHKIPVINLAMNISAKAVKKWGDYQDYRTINNAVKSLNNKLREYALLKGIDYIDMNADLSPDNTLLDPYTTDGLNLSDTAYKLWAKKIEKTLNKHGI
ncbi:MAG: hypothetical protein NVS1B13_11260 [Flavisolibacter sp.]